MDRSVTAPVDIQLQAYNDRDIEAFMSVYCEETSIIRLPNTPTLQGLTAIRERYQQLFDTSPQLSAVVHKRIVQGEWVVDHESVTGASMPGVGEAIVAYQVRDAKIINVYLIK
ncbi:MAG: nuclear transport factor 2 family protein [Pseudomonadota bacterium]